MAQTLLGMLGMSEPTATGTGLLGQLGTAVEDNSSALMGMGLGLLGGQGSADAWSQAMRGYMGGEQQDAQRRLIKQKQQQELQKRTAAQSWAQQNGVDPRLAEADPDGVLNMAQQLEMKKRTPKEYGLEETYLRNLQKTDPARFQQAMDGKIGLGGGPFSGNSIDAQGLNYLVRQGRITQEQAADIATGKTVTNPIDNSIRFIPGSQLAGGGAPTGNPANQDPQGAPQSTPSGGPGVALTPGTGPKPPTEDQAKNRQLFGRAVPQLQIAEQNFDALSGMGEALGSRLPLGDFVTSEQYQRANTAVRDIASSYLYSVSGASANPGEVESLASTLMPRPGEKPGQVADKKARLRQMVESIKERAAYAPGTGPQAQQTPKPQRQAAPPSAAVDHLRKNPALRRDFDAKYGPGASAAALGIPDA